MKHILMSIPIALAIGNVQAQTAPADFHTGSSVGTSATILSTFELATDSLISPFVMTSTSIQARGVAGIEQLKDEIVLLHDDMGAGRVRLIEEIRQPALKELFLEILNDEEQMREIEKATREGSTLERVASVVTISLLMTK